MCANPLLKVLYTLTIVQIQDWISAFSLLYCCTSVLYIISMAGTVYGYFK